MSGPWRGAAVLLRVLDDHNKNRLEPLGAVQSDTEYRGASPKGCVGVLEQEERRSIENLPDAVGCPSLAIGRARRRVRGRRLPSASRQPIRGAESCVVTFRPDCACYQQRSDGHRWTVPGERPGSWRGSGGWVGFGLVGEGSV